MIMKKKEVKKKKAPVKKKIKITTITLHTNDANETTAYDFPEDKPDKIGRLLKIKDELENDFGMSFEDILDDMSAQLFSLEEDCEVKNLFPSMPLKREERLYRITIEEIGVLKHK